MSFYHGGMDGSDTLIPNVRALSINWNENGLVTSRGPGLHGRLERERERENGQCIIHQNNDYIMLHSSFLIPE